MAKYGNFTYNQAKYGTQGVEYQTSRKLTDFNTLPNRIYINTEDLQRINNHMSLLEDLQDYGFVMEYDFVSTTWQDADIVPKVYMMRMANILYGIWKLGYDKLIADFPQDLSTPNYLDMNKVETLQYYLSYFKNDMEYEEVECGELELGADL